MEEKFVFRKIDSPESLQESYRLRFQVYCKECNFIREEDYPQGYETDELDAHSLHFGGFDTEGRLIGAVRLITSSCDKFPIEEHCPKLDVDWGVVRRQECAEISRLTISKVYRRRSNDGLYYEPQVADMTVEEKGQHFMRRVRPMAFGLYRAIYQECKRVGINHWFALMERSLWTLLKIHGFVFKPIGPEVNFYGTVAPYLADIPELEKSVYMKFPQFFAYFIESLEPELQPKF
ncbi:MAG: PEP-CTERM/exosortase system-associated acyltransferase [Candidatus Omnitrophica bacterium]|nr:PEP-CTERM/exosortase system-associated acyltransferase [Candidatus Omnitrophota bacterium]